jgi:hypothetical protein
LTTWNDGEAFASLGIAHFIWYPNIHLSEKRFHESFPEWLAWMTSQNVDIPVWLQTQVGCPWQNKAVFERSKNTVKMQELRSFLSKTRSFQVKFIKNRLKHALPNMLHAAPAYQRKHIQQQFEYVATSPMGFYALMDYVNFKGEGTDIHERYQGKGWGLLQVLSGMHSQGAGVQTIEDFSRSAAAVLSQRVALSPQKNIEQRWLAGWKKRLRTYVREAKKSD